MEENRSDRESRTKAGQQTAEGHKYTPFQRAAAMAGVVILAGLYVLTFFAALMDAPWSGRLFKLCLGLTVVLPVFLWICIWAVGVLTRRHTIASPDILNSDKEERHRMEEALRQAAGPEESVEKGDGL